MTAGLLPLDDVRFHDLFTAARYSVFRLETLQRYDVAYEAVEFAAFLAGQDQPADPSRDGWNDMLAARARRGAPVRRVHVLTEPLSDYVRYEATWAYGPHVPAGEDIRIITVPPGGSWPDDVSRRDFWLFDSHILYDMHYDEQGALLGIEPVGDPARIVAANAARDAAWHHATPWTEWIATRPDLARLVPA